jgi:hypothetical protein
MPGQTSISKERQAEVMHMRDTIRGLEQAKRQQLRAELQAERRQPLFDHVLPPAERKAIALEVRTGLMQQSGFPGAWRSQRS